MPPVLILNYKNTCVGRVPAAARLMRIGTIAECDFVPTPAADLKNPARRNGRRECEGVRRGRVRIKNPVHAPAHVCEAEVAQQPCIHSVASESCEERARRHDYAAIQKLEASDFELVRFATA